MRILVTRPEPGASQLAELLRRRGHEPLVEPLLTIRLRMADRLPLDGAQALIATSRNGLAAVARARNLADAFDLPLFAVGVATANLAREMGFAHVVQGPGRAADLTHEIAGRLEPMDGVIVHLAGESLAFDLKSDLELLGYRVRQLLLYSSEPVAGLSASTIAAFEEGRIDGVVAMSPRTAGTYVKLIVGHGLAGAVAGVLHVCMSDAIARALTPLGSIAVRIARAPEVDELLALIDGVAAQSQSMH